ncbi:amidohydrolase family protein [Frankia sp. Cas4]|uniref:amidohydrolase family protein n=1 Tax=Frankia sp. Cas4 TaxID=3073927 RepID=UPI002AD53B7A|nr:amidohydrolase family protein [Frankia sp. Cas4]
MPAVTHDPGGLGYLLVDADNHFYEPADCFSAYIDPTKRDLAFHAETVDGENQYLVAGRRYTYLEEPFAETQVRPGALASMLRDRYRETPEPVGSAGRPDFSATAAFVPMDPAWQNRDARIALMDRQGVQSVIMLPTLGVTVEHFMKGDPVATYANLNAFNRWLEENWGFAYLDRIFPPALISLLDVQSAVVQIEQVLAAGARFVVMKPGPVGGKSPAHPDFDAAWARLAEARVPVIFHVGEAGFNELYSASWGENPNPSAYRASAFQWCNFMVERPIMDTIAALVFHNLFGRFPDLRVLTIENGSAWVPYLLHSMDKKKGMGRNGPWIGGHVVGRPSEIFKEHVRVTPFHEDDLETLIGEIGAEAVLFGSDYPHAEGIAEPADFVTLVSGLDAAAKRRILRDNTLDLMKGHW